MRARFVGASRPPTPSRSVGVASAPSPTSAAAGGSGTTATRHGEFGRQHAVVAHQRCPRWRDALDERGEVIAHQPVDDPVADGVAGSDVGMDTAIGHRRGRGQSDACAITNPLFL